MDVQYSNLRYQACEREHAYGPSVHILGHPYMMSLLARLCARETAQPLASQLLHAIYDDLLAVVVNAEFPRRVATVPSRMSAYHREGIYVGEVLDPETKAITVAIARAGLVPSHMTYDALNFILNPALVRQDHVFMNRRVENGRVVGVDLSGSKIGGPVEGSIVLVPDPMGATGSSMIETVSLYKRASLNPPRKFVAMHLIVTPEYLKAVQKAHPDVIVYAVRLDRGLSSEDVLQTVPGTHWDREKGLNEHDYIVPGGGGFGEVLNNALT
ncbi:MAG: uracil phosphoribosyltransferase [Planctomycetota bacterium]